MKKITLIALFLTVITPVICCSQQSIINNDSIGTRSVHYAGLIDYAPHAYSILFDNENEFRNHQESGHLVDSIIIFNNTGLLKKETFTWTPTEYRSSEEKFNWNNINDKWDKAEKYTYDYEKDDKVVTTNNWWGDVEKDIWLKTSYNTMIYDDHRNMLNKEIFTYWDDKVEKYSKEVCEYNEKNQIVLLTYDNYNAPVYFYREYTYDDHDNLLSEINYSGGRTSAGNKYVYEYDPENRMATKERYLYDYNTDTWNKYQKTKYTYNDKDLIIDEVLSFYYPGGYQPYSRYISEYDKDGNRTLYEELKTQGGSENWRGVIKREIGYENGNQTSCKFYYWDYDYWTWYLRSENKISYNENGKILSYENYGYKDEYSFDWDIIEKCTYEYNGYDDLINYKIYRWDENDSDLSLKENMNIYYTINPTSVETIQESRVKAYLENGILSIENPSKETISIYSVNGQILYSAIKSDGILTIDTTHLPKGVLIIKGKSGWVKKVINK